MKTNNDLAMVVIKMRKYHVIMVMKV